MPGGAREGRGGGGPCPRAEAGGVSEENPRQSASLCGEEPERGLRATSTSCSEGLGSSNRDTEADWRSNCPRPLVIGVQVTPPLPLGAGFLSAVRLWYCPEAQATDCPREGGSAAGSWGLCVADGCWLGLEKLGWVTASPAVPCNLASPVCCACTARRSLDHSVWTASPGRWIAALEGCPRICLGWIEAVGIKRGASVVAKGLLSGERCQPGLSCTLSGTAVLGGDTFVPSPLHSFFQCPLSCVHFGSGLGIVGARCGIPP